MPKIFGREVGIVWIAAGAAVATYLVYTVAFPPPEASLESTVRRGAAPTKKKTDQYVESDYSIKFAAASEPVRDSFRPLIIRDAPRGNDLAGGIPSSYASGDGNWVYSGMATVNGVPQALLENRTTGDSEFVTRGERWRSAVIGTITADSLTLTGPSGAITLAAGGPTEPSVDPSVSAPGSVAPVPVPQGLQGQIGANMGANPANSNNNGGRRRGGRRMNNADGSNSGEGF
jgi:hypothetical protein